HRAHAHRDLHSFPTRRSSDLDGKSGLSGDEEAAAFARLPPPDRREVERVAHLVLMQLLPAVAVADLTAFGAALTEVQRITGGWFAPAQGGVFAPGETGGLVERLREGGAMGVGQSSWGPAVYGIVAGAAAAHALAERVRGTLGPGGAVHEGPFSARGARVRRGEIGRASCRDGGETEDV